MFLAVTTARRNVKNGLQLWRLKNQKTKRTNPLTSTFLKSHDFSNPSLLFVGDLSHNFQKQTGSTADISKYFLSPPSHPPLSSFTSLLDTLLFLLLRQQWHGAALRRLQCAQVQVRYRFLLPTSEGRVPFVPSAGQSEAFTRSPLLQQLRKQSPSTMLRPAAATAARSIAVAAPSRQRARPPRPLCPGEPDLRGLSGAEAGCRKAGRWTWHPPVPPHGGVPPSGPWRRETGWRSVRR